MPYATEVPAEEYPLNHIRLTGSAYLTSGLADQAIFYCDRAYQVMHIRAASVNTNTLTVKQHDGTTGTSIGVVTCTGYTNMAAATDLETKAANIVPAGSTITILCSTTGQYGYDILLAPAA